MLITPNRMTAYFGAGLQLPNGLPMSELGSDCMPFVWTCLIVAPCSMLCMFPHVTSQTHSEQPLGPPKHTISGGECNGVIRKGVFH